jgi:hypothetical protein
MSDIRASELADLTNGDTVVEAQHATLNGIKANKPINKEH